MSSPSVDISAEIGPALPSWWKTVRTAPDPRFTGRLCEGEEVFVTFGFGWRLLDHWARYNRPAETYVASVNRLIQQSGNPCRIKFGNARVEKELKSRADKINE